MAIFRFGEHRPQVAASAWVAENATVVGQVEIGDAVGVWYGAVLRGDNDRIRIGRNSNIQDGSVLHTDMGLALEVGEGVTVGHQCMLHGCTIGDGTLVGLQAVVLNGARIGRQCLVAAGALVTEGKELPERTLVMGAPAKAVRALTEAELARLARAATHYAQLAVRHRTGAARIA